MKLVKVISCLVITAWSLSVQAVDDKEVQKAIELARQSFEKAVKEQGGWVSTKKLIKSAELTATKGNRQKALELAEQARHEADLSLQQAINQRKNWDEPGYLK